MNSIGYAVSASPKAHEVLSNGLFKDLKIDAWLYLDTTINELTKGESLICIERINKNKQNRKQDAILIAFFSYGSSEYRKSSFISSAIAFRDFQVNSSKLKDKLFDLFQQIKQITDTESRIKLLNANDWNIDLPSSNIQTKEKLMFNPTNTSNTLPPYVVQVASLKATLPVLLDLFMLNHALHNVNKLYITSNSASTTRLANKGVKTLSFNKFFNFNSTILYWKNQLNEKDKELEKKGKEENRLQNRISSSEQKIKQLESDCNALNNKEKAIKNNIANLQKEEAHSKEQLSKLEKTLADLKKQIRKEEPIKQGNANSQEIQKYKNLLQKASDVIRKLDSNDRFTYSNDEELINKYHNNFGDLKSEKKLKRIILISLFTYFLLSLILGLGFLTYKGYKKFNNKRSDSTIIQTAPQDNTVTTNIQKEDKSVLILETLKEVDGDNVSQDKLATHNQKIKEAIDLINSKDLSIDHELYQFVVNREWRFWELIHSDNDLTDDFTQLFNDYLETKFGITEFYFDDLYELYQNEDIDEEQKEIIEKRLNNYYFLDIPIENLKYLGSAKKSYDKKGKAYQTIFDPYVDEDNDLYQEVNDSYKEDKDVLLKHFAYIIKNEKLNEGADLENLQVIFLPYIK